jgi:hypothetical protein
MSERVSKQMPSVGQFVGYNSYGNELVGTIVAIVLRKAKDPSRRNKLVQYAVIAESEGDCSAEKCRLFEVPLYMCYSLPSPTELQDIRTAMFERHKREMLGRGPRTRRTAYGRDVTNRIGVSRRAVK